MSPIEIITVSAGKTSPDSSFTPLFVISLVKHGQMNLAPIPSAAFLSAP